MQNLAQGAHEPLINSDDEITMLILEVPLQNLLAYLIIQSGDANIRRGVLPGFWSAGCTLWCSVVAAGPPSLRPRRRRNHTVFSSLHCLSR